MPEQSPEDLCLVVASPAAAGMMVVALVGEIDLSNAAEVEQRLVQLGAEAPRLVVDLRRLEFADSTGFSALLRVVRSLEAKGTSVALAEPHRSLRHTIEVMQVGEALRVVDSLDAATESPSGRA